MTASASSTRTGDRVLLSHARRGKARSARVEAGKFGFDIAAVLFTSWP